MKEMPVNNDEVYAYEPDYTLRNILGENFDTEKYFKERIVECQNVIDSARNEFFEDEKTTSLIQKAPRPGWPRAG